MIEAPSNDTAALPITRHIISSQLRGRSFCARWQMGPALITLAVCVMGVFFSLVMKSPYLCIPFGLGVACSLYGVYQGWHYKDFQTSQEQLNQQESITQEMDRELTELKGFLAALEAALQKGGGEISSAVEELHTEKEELQGVRQALQKLIGAVDPSHFVQICNSMADMQAKIAASTERLPELQREVEQLQQTKQELARVVQTIQKKLAEEARKFSEENTAFSQKNAALTKIQESFEAFVKKLNVQE